VEPQPSRRGGFAIARLLVAFAEEVMGYLADVRESIASTKYSIVHPADAHVVL
jgi:hypothetical protein